MLFNCVSLLNANGLRLGAVPHSRNFQINLCLSIGIAINRCYRHVKITDMKNKLKQVRCDNCKFFNHTDKPRYDGICTKDNTYTAEHRVCNKLPTDEDRRNAKLRRNG